MALFESYERRINQINAALAKNGIGSIEEAKQICDDAGIDVYNMKNQIRHFNFALRATSVTDVIVSQHL